MKRFIAFKPRARAMRRAHTLVMLLLDTGLRITEALTLERCRVDLERRCVTVNGKGSRERMVPISAEKRRALFLWLSRSKGRTNPELDRFAENEKFLVLKIPGPMVKLSRLHESELERRVRPVEIRRHQQLAYFA